MISRTPPADRLIGIEGLRFLGAVAILVWHYQHFLFVKDLPVGYVPDQAPFYPALHPVYSYGYLGVALFWCVSGFIFMWKYGVAVSSGNIGFRHFLLLRFARLYPLHIATFSVAGMLGYMYFNNHSFYYIYQFNNLKHAALNILFAQWWWLQDGYSFNGPSWSISLEILLYFAFFMIARVVGAGILVNGVIAALGVGLTVFLDRSPLAQLNFLDAVTFFYLGAVVCHLVGMARSTQVLRQRFLAGLALCAAATACWLLHVGRLQPLWATMILAPSLIVWFELISYELPSLVGKWFVTLGNLTYASYMIHYPLQAATVLAFGALAIRPHDYFYQGIFFLAYVIITFVLSYFVYHKFEKPTQVFIRHLAARRRTN